jgi:hypothetical protein
MNINFNRPEVCPPSAKAMYKNLMDKADNMLAWHKDPRQVNEFFAYAEIITSLPIEWFNHEERSELVHSVVDLHGDWHEFMTNIMDGSTSYVAKMGWDRHSICVQMLFDAAALSMVLPPSNGEWN